MWAGVISNHSGQIPVAYLIINNSRYHGMNSTVHVLTNQRLERELMLPFPTQTSLDNSMMLSVFLARCNLHHSHYLCVQTVSSTISRRSEKAVTYNVVFKTDIEMIFQNLCACGLRCPISRTSSCKTDI